MVAGQRLYVISNPEDIKALLRNTKTLSWAHNLREVIQSAGGMTDGAAQILIENDLFVTMNSFYRSHLVDSGPLREASHRIYAELDTLIPKPPPSLARRHTVPLEAWTRQIIFTAATNAIYGHALLQRHPTLLLDFLAFDEGFYLLLAKVPHWKVFKARRAWNRMVEAFCDHMRSSEQAEMLPMVKQRLETLTNAGVPFVDAVRDAVGFFWAYVTYIEISRGVSLTMICCRTHANTLPVTTSLLRNILENPEVLGSVVAEINAVMPAGCDAPDITDISDSNLCPTLHAAVAETLRLTSAPMQTRTVVAPTPIGGYLLQPNSRVLLPSAHLQRAEAFWGSNTDRFDISRWSMTDGRRETTMFQQGVYRPFGSASTYCPGRLLARREMLGFIALILTRYRNLHVSGDQLTLDSSSS